MLCKSGTCSYPRTLSSALARALKSLFPSQIWTCRNLVAALVMVFFLLGRLPSLILCRRLCTVSRSLCEPAASEDRNEHTQAALNSPDLSPLTQRSDNCVSGYRKAALCLKSQKQLEGVVGLPALRCRDQMDVCKDGLGLFSMF